MNHRRFCLILVSTSTLFALAGCEKDAEIRTYSAAKDAQLVTWTQPAGWQRAEHNPKMQYAAFTTGDGAEAVKISVSFLFPDGPGAKDLLQNVNRWRNQLSLPAASAADLTRFVAVGKRDNAVTQTVDFGNPSGQRMRAAIVPRQDRIWFFKMTGPSDAVESQKESFDGFVQSAKFESAPGSALEATGEAPPQVAMPNAPTPAVPAPTSPTPLLPTPLLPATPAAANAGGLQYTLPDGWSLDPNPRPMRVMTVTTGGGKPASLIVTRLSTSFGGMLMNINRWRGEVGLPPTQDEKSSPETPVQLGENPGAMIDLNGPGKDGNTPTRSLIARATLGESVWFFKLLGPADTVKTQEPAFRSFLASLKLP